MEGVLLHFDCLKGQVGEESKETMWERGKDKLTWVALLYHNETDCTSLDFCL